jgi:hypothetical protein
LENIMSSEIETRRWKCVLCGRSKFARPGQPHRCNGQFRKRFRRTAELLGYSNAFIEIINPESEMTMSETKFNPIQLGIDWKRRDGSIARNVVRDEVNSATGLFALIDDEGQQYRIDGRMMHGGEDDGDLIEPLHPTPQPAAPGEKLQIEAGKFYRARNGARVGPMEWLGAGGEAWSGYESIAGFHRTYFSDGKWMQSSNLYPQDLIAEWTEPAAPEAPAGENAESAIVAVPNIDIGSKSQSITTYWKDGKEVTQDELYRHVGERVFEGLRKGTLPGCNSEVMRLSEEINNHINRGTELAMQLTKAEAERDKLKGELAIANQTGNELAANCDALRKQLAAAKLARESMDIAELEQIAELKQQLATAKEQLAKVVQGEAPPESDWRELSKHDQYSGPGQVRAEGDWKNAKIVATDLPYDDYAFLARTDGGNHYTAWKQARAKAGPQ